MGNLARDVGILVVGGALIASRVRSSIAGMEAIFCKIVVKGSEAVR